MTLRRVPGNLLLESGVLRTVEQQQRAHGRLGVALPGQRRGDDPRGTGKPDRVGQYPTPTVQRGGELFPCSAERKVEWVSQHAVGGPRPTDEVVGHVDRREDAV